MQTWRPAVMRHDYLTWNTNSWDPFTVYPKKYAHGSYFAVLCCGYTLIFPSPPGLLHWHCGNLTIAPVPAKQPWWIWISTSCEISMNDYITTTKQSTTKPCAYLLGYTVHQINTYNSMTRACKCVYNLQSGEILVIVTQWGLNNIVTILRTFSNALSWTKLFSNSNFTEICSQGDNYECASIGSDNVLALNRRKAIIYTKGGLVFWRTYSSLGLNELTKAT